MSNPNSSAFPFSVPTDTQLMLAADDAQSQLTSNIDNAVATIPLLATTKFSVPCLVAIDDEIVFVATKNNSNNTLTNCIRGFSGTVPSSHTSGTGVFGNVMAHHHNQLVAEIEALGTVLFNTSMNGLTPLENLLGYSESFESVAWNKTASATIPVTDVSAPTGALTGRALQEGSGSGRHGMSAGFTTTEGTAIVLSIYALKVDMDWICLGQNIGGENGRLAWFNLNTGVVGTIGANAKAAIIPVGGGWYRCLVSTTHTSAVTKTFDVIQTDANNNLSYTGTGTKRTVFWGAQVKKGNLYSTQPYFQTSGVAMSLAAGALVLDEGDLN